MSRRRPRIPAVERERGEAEATDKELAAMEEAGFFEWSPDAFVPPLLMQAQHAGLDLWKIGPDTFVDFGDPDLRIKIRKGLTTCLYPHGSAVYVFSTWQNGRWRLQGRWARPDRVVKEVALWRKARS